MKFKFVMLYAFLFSTNSFAVNSSAQCNLKTPNDILSLVKKNHPQILLNAAKGAALEESISVAKQRPNPELDAESTFADSIEGNIYTNSISLQHVFELGGKRSSRVELAQKTFKTGMAIARHENQHVIVLTVLKLHRLRQIYELIPYYEESLRAFNKILRTLKRNRSLSPEKQVERETLELASNDYKLKIAQLISERMSLSRHLTFFMGTNCTIPRTALEYNVNMNEDFSSDLNFDKYAKLNAAKFALEMSQANLGLEKSNSYPNLQIGPTI